MIPVFDNSSERVLAYKESGHFRKGGKSQAPASLCLTKAQPYD